MQGFGKTQQKEPKALLDLSKLRAFRSDACACFRQESPVLSALLDALVTTPYGRAITLVDAPVFGHQWPSLYKGLARGQIDRTRLRELLWRHAPLPAEDDPVDISLDITPILRPDSQTLADRTLVHVANAPHGATPVQPGFDMLGAMVVPEQPSAAVFPLELCRIPSSLTHRQAVVALMESLVKQTSRRIRFVLDREFGHAPFLLDTAELKADYLVRLRVNGKVYRKPPAKTGQPGRPRLHGPMLQANKTDTQTFPDAVWIADDGLVEVAAWHEVHFRKALTVPFTLYRVTRHAARDTARDPRVSWFVWRGKAALPLAAVPPLYRRRFAHEHGHRFLKQTLHWDALRVHTAERFQRWTDLVTLTLAALVLARSCIPITRRPWETATRPPTLSQVQRSLLGYWMQILPPRPGCKPRGKSPGRAKGFHPTPKSKHPVIRKTPKTKRSPTPDTPKRSKTKTKTTA